MPTDSGEGLREGPSRSPMGPCLLFPPFSGAQLKLIFAQNHSSQNPGAGRHHKGSRSSSPSILLPRLLSGVEQPAQNTEPVGAQAQMPFLAFPSALLNTSPASECDSDRKENRALMGLLEHLDAGHFVYIWHYFPYSPLSLDLVVYNSY